MRDEVRKYLPVLISREDTSYLGCFSVGALLIRSLRGSLLLSMAFYRSRYGVRVLHQAIGCLSDCFSAFAYAVRYLPTDD